LDEIFRPNQTKTGLKDDIFEADLQATKEQKNSDPTHWQQKLVLYPTRLNPRVIDPTIDNSLTTIFYLLDQV
jgi:hypothetical protein